jgi:hypothetical protein
MRSNRHVNRKKFFLCLLSFKMLYFQMVVIIGFEGSANKIGIGIIDDGKVGST